MSVVDEIEKIIN